MTTDRPTTGLIVQKGCATSGINLGGIGTGGVEIWPDGRLHNWNITNTRPWAHWQPNSKDAQGRAFPPDPVAPVVGDTDFFVRVERKGQRPLYRWLFTGHGDLATTASHFYRHHKYFFIHSIETIEYQAEYPFARLRFLDPEFPVEVELTAWTAFVPREVKDSSLPGAYFDVAIRNLTRTALDVSIVWQQQNLAGHGAAPQRQRHSKARITGAQAVRMEGGLGEPNYDTSGCMTMWARPRPGQTVTSVAGNPYMQNLIWSVHLTGGLLGPLYPPRIAREEIAETPREGAPNKGWLCVQDRLAPGGATEIQMGLAWYFPNHHSIRGTRVGHMYENWFRDSAGVAAYQVRHRDRLLAASRELPDLLRETTLPGPLKLSLLDQLSTLTKSTQFIKDGNFGLQEGHGCCALNTMDVDHYSSYALSFLFPELRETVLDMHTALAHPKNGKIHHGMEGTVEPTTPDQEGAGAYGRWDCCCQYVLQLYRDARWSGNRALLKRCWPTAKRAIDVITGLDFYGVGLPYIEGGITYDHWRMKGVVGYMAGLYLAALRALEEMATFLGEPETAERSAKLFETGRASFEKIMWNGKQYLLYYGRREKGKKTDEKEGEEGHLEARRPPACCVRPGAYDEIGDTGLMTDLLNGNGTAAVLGLGAFLEPGRVRHQLREILRRNYQPENRCVVNGSYPDQHFLDGWPFMQWQTPWTGTEYFLATQLYAAGMRDEGDAVIEWVLDRHVREGMRFDHAECNNHYARPLSIWAAYAARLGLDYDGYEGRLSICPATPLPEYSGLLQTATATSRLTLMTSKTRLDMVIAVASGSFALTTVTLACPFGARQVEVKLAASKSKAKPGASTTKEKLTGRKLAASVEWADGVAIVLMDRKLTLRPGETLSLLLTR